MFLFSRNVRDISHADDFLARFRGNDALAGGNKQHLIAAMRVHFVPGACAKIDDGKVKVVAHLGRQQRLSSHGTPVNKEVVTGSAGIASGLSTFIILLPVLVLHALSPSNSNPLSSSIPQQRRKFPARHKTSFKLT
jgi:hypothetical protein